MKDTNHDLLIKLSERVQHIEKMLENHLSHHWRITIWLLSVASSATIGTILMIVRMWISK